MKSLGKEVTPSFTKSIKIFVKSLQNKKINLKKFLINDFLFRGLFKRIIAHSGVGGFSPSYHQYSPEQAVK